MADTDEDEHAGKRICHTCIGESFLSAKVSASGEMGGCDYCGDMAPSISIDDLAERVEDAFADHYIRTATNPEYWQERLMADRESNYSWERDGSPVHEAIQDAAGLDEDPASDVLEILEQKHALYPDKDNLGEESEFSSDAHYKRRRPDGIGLHMGWHEFEQSLKTKARFFNRAGEELLVRVFGGIDAVKTQKGRPLVVIAGPTMPLDHLYRARVPVGWRACGRPLPPGRSPRLPAADDGARRTHERPRDIRLLWGDTRGCGHRRGPATRWKPGCRRKILDREAPAPPRPHGSKHGA